MEIVREELSEILEKRRRAAIEILKEGNKDIGGVIRALLLIQCVLDDYLMIRLQSDKIVEGLLADINNSIESGAIALSKGEANASHGNEPNSVPAEGGAEANESTATGTGSDPQAG
jgi:hypothetical protein